MMFISDPRRTDIPLELWRRRSWDRWCWMAKGGVKGPGEKCWRWLGPCITKLRIVYVSIRTVRRGHNAGTRPPIYTVTFVFTVSCVSCLLSVLALADTYTTGYMLNIIIIIMLLLFTHLLVFSLSKKIVLFGAVLLVVCSKTYHIANLTIYSATFFPHSTSSSRTLIYNSFVHRFSPSLHFTSLFLTHV